MNFSSACKLCSWVLLALCTSALVPLHAQNISQAGEMQAKANPLIAEAKGRTTKLTSPYTSTIRIVSKRASEDFTPDGNLNKAVWKHANWVRFDHDMSGKQRFPEAETEIATVWTPGNIYFAYRCKYSVLNLYEGENPAVEKWQLWDRDVVEAFINPTPDRVNHYYEFEVSPNNLWIDLEIDKDKTPFNDAHWDSHFEHATHIDSARRIWTCEMRIPASSMGVQRILAGEEWRLNLFRADGLGDDSQRRFLAWSTIPTGATFHVPTRFGIIAFAK